MTTITPTPAAAGTAQPRSARTTTLGFGGVLRSEWIKLRSLRSTGWSYLLVIVLAAGMSLLLALTSLSGFGDEITAGMPAEAQTDLIVRTMTVGVGLTQLVVAVLGVLVMSGEYRTGMIRSTLTAVPRRLPTLAAKAIVLFLVTFLVAALSLVGAFAASSIVYAGEGISASVADPDVLAAMLGATLYLALLAVFSLGVGTMVRSSAGGIAIVVALVLVVPTLVQVIPADWAQDAVPYLLSAAGTDLFAMDPDDALEWWQNLLVVLGWVGASGAGAAVLLARRDA
ncbi:ABC transporter permease [Agromyces sp. NPDC049794]|uniref:ABC transporter permease n=1 Tax=unclassified Agromyces TaxID=2639701 RepID=UPI0033FFD1D2